MKEIIHHDGIECHLTAEEPSPLMMEGDKPYLFLDLGTAAGEANLRDPYGPRIGCRRTDDGEGWRIVVHADGGDDPIVILDIADPVDGKTPVVVVVESELPEISSGPLEKQTP